MYNKTNLNEGHVGEFILSQSSPYFWMTLPIQQHIKMVYYKIISHQRVCKGYRQRKQLSPHTHPISGSGPLFSPECFTKDLTHQSSCTLPARSRITNIHGEIGPLEKKRWQSSNLAKWRFHAWLVFGGTLILALGFLCLVCGIRLIRCTYLHVSYSI